MLYPMFTYETRYHVHVHVIYPHQYIYVLGSVQIHVYINALIEVHTSVKDQGVCWEMLQSVWCVV